MVTVMQLCVLLSDFKSCNFPGRAAKKHVAKYVRTAGSNLEAAETRRASRRGPLTSKNKRANHETNFKTDTFLAAEGALYFLRLARPSAERG